MSADGKALVNSLYHSVIVTGLAIGYASLSKMIFKSQQPKLDFNARDVGMVAVDVALAVSSKDMLIKQGIIPDDILK